MYIPLPYWCKCRDTLYCAEVLIKFFVYIEEKVNMLNAKKERNFSQHKQYGPKHFPHLCWIRTQHQGSWTPFVMIGFGKYSFREEVKNCSIVNGGQMTHDDRWKRIAGGHLSLSMDIKMVLPGRGFPRSRFTSSSCIIS